MNSRKSLFISILLLTALLTGCTPKEVKGDSGEFDSYIKALNEERQQNLMWTEQEQSEFTAYIPDFTEQLGEFTKAELDNLIKERELSDVTALEASEDVEIFFRLLRTTYGGYHYFGGDDVFFPVRDIILSRLSEYESLSGEELGKLMTDSLSDIIVDGHFTICSNYFTEISDQFMYYVPGLYFDDVGGLDSNYVKYTIGPDGQLTHCFAALSHDGSDLPADAALSGKQHSLEWKKADAYPLAQEQEKTGYKKTEVSGLPVLESRILYALSEDTETYAQLEKLAQSGAEYRGLPVVVVDLRHNGGGDSYYARSFVEGFTGQAPQTKVAYFEKCSEPYLRTLEINPAYAMVDPEWKAGYLENRGGWNWGCQDGLPLENSSIVFLLMDKNTGSSGEDFVRYLNTADNVICVGTNTAGVLQFGNVCEFFLPHSGLFLRMGSKISFYDYVGLSEGVGVQPDLWVNPTDALDAVVRLCGYYNLNQTIGTAEKQ